MTDLQRLIDLMLPRQSHFDALAVGQVDFSSGTFESYGGRELWFDLASVSKVLGNAAAHALNPAAFDGEMRLLLEHRAGLPAWGLLPKTGWKAIIESYLVKESPTLYSDFSAMRASLEYAKRAGKTVPAALADVWDPEVKFWRDLPRGAPTVKTGERAGADIRGEVHDPNAWTIKEWCGHAGLFGTVGGVCRTLLVLDKKTSFVEKISQEMGRTPHRFVWGWDRVEDPTNTVAGIGCSAKTFGHLGFTGTSVWIDAEKRRGHVILSNATRDGWYLKVGLQEIRRAIGELVWRS
jgi:CubicO group peptidase (beta-lactamase class C family)